MEKDVKPTYKSNGDYKKINRKTIVMMKQWIYQSIYYHLSCETIVYNSWKRLNKLFESKNP